MEIHFVGAFTYIKFVYDFQLYVWRHCSKSSQEISNQLVTNENEDKNSKSFFLSIL